MMLTVSCVLRSGGIYDSEWVRKLRDGVARNLSAPYRFVCISDVDVPCERIKPEVDWPGWWLKVYWFKPGLIDGPCIYLDLDTVLTGSIDEFINDRQESFAMLKNMNDPDFVGSGVMWFKERAPEGVYERFEKEPQRIMDYYAAAKFGSYMGDQAFIFDCLDHKVDKLESPALRSYKRHCLNGLPEGTSVVAFHGRPRPTEINAEWLLRNWV